VASRVSSGTYSIWIFSALDFAGVGNSWTNSFVSYSYRIGEAVVLKIVIED
jgi:hypothetical protein